MSAVVGGVGWQLFIAYPSAERASAVALHDELVAQGVRAFLDARAIEPGDIWSDELAAALEEAPLTVVLVSERTDRAFYQRDEIVTAIALYRKSTDRRRIVPVYLDDDVDPPYGLASIQQISARAAGGMGGVAKALLPLLGLGDANGMDRGVAPGVERVAPPSKGSPFRPGMPIYFTDRLLCDSRRRLLASVLGDVRHGNNVNLIGERRTGRTSLLNHLYGDLIGEPGRAVALVNFQDNMLSEQHFYGALLRGFGRSRIADSSGSASTATYDETRAVLVELRESASPVVLIDEFERSFDNEAFAPTFFDNLRSLLGGDAHGPLLKAVVATRTTLTRYFEERQVTSVLPSYLPPRTIEQLTQADIDEVLTQASPFPLGSNHRRLAAAAAGSHPCKLQSAGEAWYRALEAGHDTDWALAHYRELSSQTCLGADVFPESPRKRRRWSLTAGVRGIGRGALAILGKGAELDRQLAVGVAALVVVTLVVLGVIDAGKVGSWILERFGS